MPDSLIDVAGLDVGAEDFLAAVLATATQPIWVVDPEGVIRFANPAALATLGYDRPDQLLGLESHSTIHHSHPDGTPYPAEECPMLLPRITGETVSRDLDWFFRRDGSMLPVSYVSAPIALGAGRGAVVAFTDIGERLHAERALRERDEMLAGQQESLLRVAEVVAGGAASDRVFAAIAREVGRVIAFPMITVWRYDAEDMATVIGDWSERPHPFRVGTCWPLDGRTITETVRATGRPARIEGFREIRGTIAGAAHDAGIGSGAGAPIVVDGHVWGALSAGRFDGDPLPERIEDQLAEFTALVATAISGSLSREALVRLADEQAALRRVATLVAEGASPGVVLDAAVGEMQALLDAYQVALNRFEPDEEILVLAHRGLDLDRSQVGARVSIEGESATADVRRTGRPARREDYASAAGELARHARATGVRSSVSVPVTLEGRVWGLITANWTGDEPPPPDTEERMSKFAELLDTAIAGAEARAQRERLAEEQAALRRVATLVARQSSPLEVLEAVAGEVAELLGTDGVGILRFEPDGTATHVAQSATPWDPVPLGTSFSLEGQSVVASVFRTEKTARLDDWTNASGAVAAAARDLGIHSSVAAPIVVEGRLWGTMVAVTAQVEPLPADTEARLAEFTELVATAISNAQARTELAASRARLAAAADDERRRLVRDLHDGAQQRLVHTVITMKLACRALDRGEDARPFLAEALAQAEEANVELRELAHGILPAVLARGGLRAGVESLASRAPVPIDTGVSVGRLPATIEATAYYVVAEALTNVAKHARATRAQVSVRVENGGLRVDVRDDGVGGARPDGSGLVGLGDRIAALDGSLQLESPAGGGTALSAYIPLPT